MQTIDKALKLLTYFSSLQPEIGLSELARMAGYDKAATRRFLVSLMHHDFIEQNPDTRDYRLGTAFLRLAHLREETFPFSSFILPVLEDLSDATRETAHASLYSGGHLANIGTVEPKRANRVHLDPGEFLPFHATASGLVFLAFSPEKRVSDAIDRERTAHTRHTITDREELLRRIDEARRSGIGMSDQGYEDEVVGLAAPVFGGGGEPVGTLAVATPSSRMSADLQMTISSLLIEAALKATAAIGGAPHPDYPAAEQQREAV